MAFVDIEELKGRGALLGIDPGTKTLGVAVCDANRLIASPVETIHKGRKLAPALTRLFELYDDRQCVGMVIGLPVNMDGSHGPRVQASKALGRNILEKREIAIAFWDERLSSAAVERTLLEADTSRARRAEVIDKMAASYILQGAIDRLAEFD